jgi:hypothetical protein
MTTAVLTHSVTKELRALLPAWTACASIIATTGLFQVSAVMPLGLLVYGLGSVGLGAQLMGQEYAHRTLGLLLSQPLSRRSLLLLKLGVLTVMLAALTTIAWTALDSSAKQELVGGGLALILLSALFVAPFLTMLTRSAVAGMVFTVALPGVLMTLINLADVWTGGQGAWAGDAFRRAMFWRGMFVIVAAAATGGWWMFVRLEDLEGRGHDLHLPRLLIRMRGAAPAPMRRRHPIVQLARKELHLQQMTLVVAGISALMMGAAILGRFAGSDVSEVFIPISIMYMAAMPFLIGSMASAEERQFGTLEWHLLLPVAAGTQWRVKAGVAIALALALGAGLPALMSWILNVPGGSRAWPTAAVALVLATSLSLYVSSLATTGIRALLTSFVVAMGCIMLTPWLLMGVERLLRYTGVRGPLGPWWYFSEWVWFGAMSLAAGLASLLLLYFASMNHRSAERPRVQLRRQVGWIAAMAVVFAVGLAFLGVH